MKYTTVKLDGGLGKRSIELSRFFHNTKMDIPGYTADMDEELRETIDIQFKRGDFTYGYREGVVLVNVPTNPKLHSRVVKVDQDTEFVTVCKSRVPGEKPRKKTMALVDELPVARYLKAVLYRADVLAEDNDRSSEADWEVVALLAQMDDDEPMNTATLMANHFKADGGTDTKMSPEQFENALRKSYHYWKDRSFGITKEEWQREN
jgi:hypothetical protein